MSFVKIVRLTAILVLCCTGATAFAAETQWYVRKVGTDKNLGPYTDTELEAEIQAGKFGSTDYVWSKALGSWTALASAKPNATFRDPAEDASTPPPFPEDAAEKGPETTATEHGGRMYVTPLLGIALPLTGSSSSASFAYGGEIGFNTSTGRYGLLIATSTDTATVQGITETDRTTVILFSATADLGPLYYGGRIGLGLTSVNLSNSTNSLSSSGSSLSLAPVLGLRFQVAPKAHVGIEASWISIYGSTLTGDLGTATIRSRSYLAPLAVLAIDF